MVPRTILSRSGLISVNIVRPVNTVQPRTTMNNAGPMKNVINKAYSTARRPFNNIIAANNSNFTKKVNTVKGTRVNIAMPKAVLSSIKGNKGNAVKTSACWVWRPKHKVLDHVSRNNGASMSFKRFDYINAQGESKHMTRNRSYLIDYEEIDRGFVAFGGNSKGGKITGKGKVRTDFKLTDESHVLLKVPRKDNMYNVDLKNVVPPRGLTCLFAKATSNESELWHRRLGHVNFKTMNKLVRGNLVRGLPSKLFEINQTCVACQKGKQHRASCKTKTVSSISQPLQMLHMDLFGLTFVKSLMKKMYCLVVTDDFSRFSWVFFLATKDETSEILKTFITSIENLIDLRVKVIRCDNGTEFKNRVMNQFCEMKGIKREFSVARTPQQNRVAKRKNRTLIEAARTMLADSKLPTTFWTEVVNTACYVQNRVLVIKPHNKTPYELFLGRKPALSFMRPFGCPVTILNTIDHLGSRPNWLFDIDALRNSMNYKPIVAGNQSNGNADPPFSSSSKDSPDAGFKPSKEEEKKDAEDPGNEGGNPSEEGDRVDQEKDTNVNNTNNTNTASPTVNAAGIDDNAVDENIVYGCADDPNMPDSEEIGRFSDIEDDDSGADINNLDTYFHVSPVPTTRIHKDHPLNQVIGDLQSATQTRQMTKNLEEYSSSTEGSKLDRGYAGKASTIQATRSLDFGFEDPDFPDRVYKVEKALYGLHQAPRACQDKYAEILKKFGFSDVKTASTPMETHKPLLKDADGEDVDEHLYRSMIGSLMYLTSSRPDIMFAVCVCARFQVNPKVSHLHAVKRIFRYLKGQPKLGLWYPKDSPFDLVAYTDSDYAGASLDRKSTTGGCQFLGCRLISWQCKKQTVVANSTTEAEYIVASNCYGQTKHIEIRHHFIRDSNEKKLIQMIKIHTEQNVVDLLTKAFDRIIHKGWLEWNAIAAKDGIGVKNGNSRVNDAGHYLVLLGEKNANFAEIVDFLNANLIRYALTVSPTVYVSCIEQFWSSAKTKIINNETQIHAKVEGKTIVISESSVRRDLQFDDEDSIACLTNTEIFENLQLMGYEKLFEKLTFYKPYFSSQWKNLDSSKKFLMYPRFLQLFLNKQIENLSKVNVVYDTPSHTKKILANMRRQGKDFSGTVTPLFSSMLEQQADMGEGSDEAIHEKRGDSVERTATTATSSDTEQDSGNITRTQSTVIHNIPLPREIGSGGRPRPQETMGDRPAQTKFESLSKQSYDSPLGGVNTPRSDEDRIELKELMETCTKLSERVLDLEITKTAQAKEIANLKKRVKKLERKRKSRTPGMNLFKIGTSRRRSLGEEDASKQGRNLKQGKQRSIFEESDFDDEDEVPTGDAVNTAGTEFNTASAPVTIAGVFVSTDEPITTASEVVTIAEPGTPPTTTTTIIEDEDLIIAQTLIKMKSEKSKVRGVTMQEPSETATRLTVPPPQHDPKDKGKAKMVEPEKPLKRKD
ncbi:putative ribonuclease H-like domain-containing protein [Tanacetum coccineum]